MKGLDLERLRSYLGTGELTATMFAGGRSNLTYAVSDGTSRWVLRRPPLGHVLPTAHDMVREHKVLGALSAAGFPAPRPIRLCTDTDVIGAPFCLMEHVDGTIYRDPVPLEKLGPAIGGLVLSLVDTLADLHALDPDAIGLGDFGRPEGFNERQVRRWKKQLDASRSRDVPGIEELHARLAAEIPAGGPGSVVHGDFRLDNVLIGDELQVNAVLDWEMSTLGDPLSDVALMLVYAGRPLLDGRTPLSIPGHPGVDEMAARYAARSGRDVSDLHWYVGFAAFKLAVILEGVHYRFVQGQTLGEGFDTVGEMVAPLVARGHAALDGTLVEGN
ncbi:phosphotransferase family protein [Actinoplanes sp. NPDC051494]|uniref:phosphotransferase family protein n=1 Tax=Actinoplanes sp. NPDC051494 TaxID=3363907 RepID=UPI0037877DAE